MAVDKRAIATRAEVPIARIRIFCVRFLGFRVLALVIIGLTSDGENATSPNLVK
jgi:hypothetical protein